MINRRNFLKNFGFAGAVIAAPGSLVHAGTASQQGRSIKGRVTDGSNGIANVAVTDGFSITTTDKRGNYEFVSNDAADFVYISVPAGYEIPAEKHIARFYRSLKSNDKSFDFQLQRLSVDDSKHNFIVWADTQVISKEDADQLKRESVPDLKALIATYPAGTLFHGIGCGDLVWDHFELFADYKEAVDATGVTFYNVIGNHDMNLEALGDEGSAEEFKNQFGPTYYSFNRGKIHYVVLDDVFFIGAAKKYIGYFTETQLSWLKKDLALLQPGATVVLSLHIPTMTGAPKRNKKEEELGGSVSNRKKLYDILKPYNTHIMSGHTHFNESWEEGNIMEHNHGTVCGAWWTGPVCSDGTPAGYGVYEVNGDKVEWFYKGTGKPKDHQLRIYGKGKYAATPNDIAANVWNWDTKWKVEWFEDGVFKGQMQQRVVLDAMASELYLGPMLPGKHKWVEPTLTDHIFFATPSENAKEIKVKATDRFGKEYLEVIRL